ncbi:MAG: ATP-dependent Clp protease ATP-binding subunit [Candidatus Hydrogenedentes bacterium]|nr:ATP-dependent Clp protease ATP-binding subunit [Candidatus Hydrogenedentota bacterium]
MNLNISSDIAGIVEKAIAAAVNRGQFFVGVEQLFTAILETADQLPDSVKEQWLNPLFATQREVGKFVWRTPVRSPSGEVAYSPRAIQVLMHSSKVIRGGPPASAGHLLLAILLDGLSSPSRGMDWLKLDRVALAKLLQQELPKLARPTVAQAAPGAAASPAPAGSQEVFEQVPATGGQAASLESLTRNLSEMGRRGELSKVVGRDEEMYQILQILSRRNKNNIMLVGEAGVGKTQLVEGLARFLAKNPSAGNYEFLELNLAALMAGTQYRGAFEEKILVLLEQLKGSENTVLFIDEVHLIMGAGATESGSMDFANLIKPALARGEIRCIGATTITEYRKFVEKDPAIERRFQMVRVEELSEDATLQVLQVLQQKLEQHHQIKISPRSLSAAIALSQQYLPNLRLPDKAIDVLDQACARYRLKLMGIKHTASVFNTPEEKESLTPHEVRKVISQMTGVPIEELTGRERMQLNDLEKRLLNRIIGQDEAVTRAAAAIKKSRAGLSDPNRPDAVMLFLGPSGVGKTHLAKVLSEEVFGSPKHLMVFDMSEYVEEHSVSRLLGAPPGYSGHEEEGRLASAVRANPFCILLFDEIEKAHPRIFDIFLPILEEGRLKDNRGRLISFRNSVLIFTSNIGAALLKENQVDTVREALLEELQQHFRPELGNRIDDIIPFYPLLAEDVRKILWLEMKQVKARLDEKQIAFKVYQRAYETLAEAGYSPEYGARELRRVVDQRVTRPMSDLIISGEVQAGDTIEVVMQENELIVRKAVEAMAEAVAG